MNWLADKIEQWPTAKLLPYARNARTHSKDARRWRAAHPSLAQERSRAACEKWRAEHPAAKKAEWQRYREKHTERVRMNKRASELVRRSKKRGGFVEHVDPLVVFKRDKGLCGLCSLEVQASDKWHIDHVVPLSKGGAHSYANVQLAHARCNLSKGASLLRKAG